MDGLYTCFGTNAFPELFKRRMEDLRRRRARLIYSIRARFEV